MKGEIKQALFTFYIGGSGVDITISTSLVSYTHKINFVVLFVCRSINFHFHFFKGPRNNFDKNIVFKTLFVVQ